MFFSRQIRKFFLTIIFTVMLAITIAFDFGTADSWAASSLLPFNNQSKNQIIAINRAEAITKNIQGRAQEAIGNITGDPKDQIAGKAKQVESQARYAAEDIKDNIKLNGRAKAVAKNLEGKAQQAQGQVTHDRQNQIVGQAKQTESQARNIVEDIKDTVRDILN